MSCMSDRGSTNICMLVSCGQLLCTSDRNLLPIVQVLANEMVRCTPDRGSVHSGSTLDLELTLNFMEPQVVSTQLTVEVRGGKPVKMPIRGEAVLPAIDIQEPTLDMGSVYTGVVARMPLTVVNTTPVVAGQQ